MARTEVAAAVVTEVEIPQFGRHDHHAAPCTWHTAGTDDGHPSRRSRSCALVYPRCLGLTGMGDCGRDWQLRRRGCSRALNVGKVSAKYIM